MRGINLVIKDTVNRINDYKDDINIMVFSETHISAIEKYVLKDILNSNFKFSIGSSCPVTLIPPYYIDYLYNLALTEDVILATYGELLRIPGSSSEITLEKAKVKGASIQVIFSSLDAINIAIHNQSKKVIFLATGFETNIGATIISLTEAINKELNNFYILSLHRCIKGIISYFINEPKEKVDGFILPGNISLIIGEEGYSFINKHKIPSVITGFSFLDIVSSVEMIVNQKIKKEGKVEDNYKLFIPYDGNGLAKSQIEEFFYSKAGDNRAIGKLEESIYSLKSKYDSYDIEKIYPLSKYIGQTCSGENKICEKVIKGELNPTKCIYFKNECKVSTPIGPTMASSEGACYVLNKYL
ncbi:hydrogenase formation protein HypD [Clostridium paridis]|uniref:Hydrogenase formation protein HypD n=1 Tax=Clostridium paridis TaxID=2803863 RepID=A0A937FFC2_9CLOT|nr:hydrogenase formation protein HypD [Clostridium paridis]MBL4932960.1 hydrogenase formation protein HypD [Clostridium paridis]